MKIGIDIHGVIDENREFFIQLTSLLCDHGHEVHIITGKKVKAISGEEMEGITYTHLFSITDYHESIGTPISYDDKGNPHMDPYLWNKTKGEYCLKHGIDLHFDDSDIYSYFFKTPYARILNKNTKRVEKIEL